MAIVRERFTSEVTLTPATVSAFADSVDDTNPVHHDPAFAASTRYKRPIASGTHRSALLLALTASRFSKTGEVEGLLTSLVVHANNELEQPTV